MKKSGYLRSLFHSNFLTISFSLKLLLLFFMTGSLHVSAFAYHEGRIMFSTSISSKVELYVDFSQQQFKKIIISGKVTNPSGQILTGVAVTVPGTTKAVVTDTLGNYVIRVEANDSVLVFSFMGMKKQEIKIGGRMIINVRLEPYITKLDEIVVVGYGTQKRATVTGAISSIGGDNLTKAPVVNLTNSLVGRLPGLVAINKSGEPGNDGSTLLIRGTNTLNNNNPLIVVDEIANRSMDHLAVRDIESVTILKDASAAIYGAQAANGVILVTTKRGKVGKPTIILNYNTGFNSPTRIPKMADAATYSTMMNEINEYAAKPDVYSTSEIQKFKDGSDPLHYPNTNWFNEVFNTTAPQSSGSITFNGGSTNFKYFLSLGEISQVGIYKNSATKYLQHNFRSNIDGEINKYVNVSFNVSGREEIKNFPTRSSSEIFRFLMRGKPNMIASWPNGLPGPDIEYGDNPVVIATNLTGYDKNKFYVLESNLKLNITNPWNKGLSFTANAAFDKNFDNHKIWKIPWYLYGWDGTSLDANNQPVLSKNLRGYSAPELQQNFLDRLNITANALLNYETRFAYKYAFKAMIGSERFTKNEYQSMTFRKYYLSSFVDQIFSGGAKDMSNDGNESYAARLNYFGRINYNYNERYLAEFVWRYDGSYIFPRGSKQFGFFPGISFGWKVSDEKFWKKNLSFIDNFKLRVSWGRTGNDRIDEYQYLLAYGFDVNNYTYIFNNNAENKVLHETQIPNPNVTWEVANQSNIGFESSLFNSKLSFVFDYFHNVRSKILIYRNATVPSTSGLTLPRENLGKVNNNGVEGVLTYRDNVGVFKFEVSANGGYSKNKIIFWDETSGKPDYQQITGHPTPNDVNNPDGNLYFQAIGIYRDQAQVDATPHWPGARSGDIIFKDVNNDGIINGADKVRSYKTGVPGFIGGFSWNISYKHFDFFVLLQGATGGQRYIMTESGEIGNYLAAYANNRWTRDNINAVYPRTFNRMNEYWVGHPNTFWLKSNNYIRLKNLELGYTFPKNVNKILGILDLRIFFNGFNLLLFDKLKVYDPESDSNNGQIYPLNKVVNIGVTITF